jgi:hypothetical protein
MAEGKKKSSSSRSSSRGSTRGRARSDTSTRGGVPRRGGTSDPAAEARTSAPRSKPPEHHGPSSRPVSEGLEGAIFEENDES